MKTKWIKSVAKSPLTPMNELLRRMDVWKDDGNKRTSVAMSIYGEDDGDELAGDDWHFNVSFSTLSLLQAIRVLSRLACCGRPSGQANLPFNLLPLLSAQQTLPQIFRHHPRLLPTPFAASSKTRTHPLPTPSAPPSWPTPPTRPQSALHLALLLQIRRSLLLQLAHLLPFSVQSNNRLIHPACQRHLRAQLPPFTPPITTTTITTYAALLARTPSVPLLPISLPYEESARTTALLPLFPSTTTTRTKSSDPISSRPTPSIEPATSPISPRSPQIHSQHRAPPLPSLTRRRSTFSRPNLRPTFSTHRDHPFLPGGTELVAEARMGALGAAAGAIVMSGTRGAWRTSPSCRGPRERMAVSRCLEGRHRVRLVFRSRVPAAPVA
jgi:hypothetical protein